MSTEKKSFIDAHCHLADEKLREHLPELLELARQQGITAFIQGGVHPKDWNRQLELAGKFPGAIFPSFGIHPWFVAGRMGLAGDELREPISHALKTLPEYLSKPEAVAIGEMGIDLGPKTDPSTLDYQKEIFSEQLRIAAESRKPLVLHIVRAHPEALEILKEYGPYPQGGLVHAFSGSYEIAQEYTRLGLTLSIGGVAARQGYETLKRALKRIPVEQLVVESDSPDQLPEGFQGFKEGMNDPRSLWVVAEAICQLKGDPNLTPERLLQSSRDRLIRIFRLELGGTSL